MIKFLFILFTFCTVSCGGSSSGSSASSTPQKPDELVQYRLEVVAEYPHDDKAYTQGLFFHDGILYESTGQYGESSLRQVDLSTGDVLSKVDVSSNYFVEGSVVLGDKLYVLTWRENVLFIHNPDDLSYIKAMSYPWEGWGLTTDGTVLIASDGTSKLHFIDADLKHKKSVTVKLPNGREVPWLNELEYIDGKVWANVYTGDEIVIINPKTGYVEGLVDCRGLLAKSLYTYDTDVLNGIAYNPEDGKIYLTGKNWPKLFEVRLIEKK